MGAQSKPQLINEVRSDNFWTGKISTTLTHAYNCTVSPVTGFNPYFLMFGRNPKLPLDIDLGIPTMEQEPTSQQNYAQKLYSKITVGIPKSSRK